MFLPKTLPVPPEALLFGTYAYSYSGSLGGDDQTFAGHINFHGDGSLNGGGNVFLSHTGKLKPVTFNGQYALEVQLDEDLVTGTFNTIDQYQTELKYYFVVAAHWNELKFMVTDAKKAPLVADTMRRVLG